MKKYMVNDITQETSCDLCGAPIRVGNTAYASDDEINVYCSKECYNEGEGIQEEDFFNKVKRCSFQY